MFKDRLFSARGFTLIELLVIIAIIGILATIVVPQVKQVREEARIAKASAAVKYIFSALLMLESDTYEWPGHQNPYEVMSGAGGNEICPDGCAFGLSDCQSGLLCTDGLYQNWGGPYINTVIDPWGREYFFDTDYDIDPTAGENWAVVIGSYGPDGIGNNLYNADDIIFVIERE